MDPQYETVFGYLALGQRLGATGHLDDRTRLLVALAAAERSGCRWCLDHARHDWRAAGLSLDLLSRSARQDPAAPLTEPERAAVAVVDAVARGGDSGAALRLARRHYSDRALAELFSYLARYHLLPAEP